MPTTTTHRPGTRPTGAKNAPVGRGARRGPSQRRSGEEGRSQDKARGPRREAPRAEFDNKILNIRRVTRVVAGGRRFNFSVAVAIGNRKGTVGVGLGKAGDTTLAIEKAERDARKNAVRISTTASFSISHDVSAKYCAAIVTITPAPGRGLVAGSAVRSVLELAGINDVTAKILSRSKNKLNNARATVKALESLKRPMETKKQESTKGK